MSNTPKHTPGPWRIVGVDGAIYADNGIDVGLVHGVNREADESEDHEMHANACLIAAAPELLEACEQAEYWLQCEAESAAPGEIVPTDILRVLRAAIAKAEGC